MNSLSEARLLCSKRAKRQRVGRRETSEIGKAGTKRFRFKRGVVDGMRKVGGNAQTAAPRQACPDLESEKGPLRGQRSTATGPRSKQHVEKRKRVTALQLRMRGTESQHIEAELEPENEERTRPSSREDQPPRYEPQHIHTAQPPHENRDGQHDGQISGEATERSQDGDQESHDKRTRSSLAAQSLNGLHTRDGTPPGDQVDPARSRWRRRRPLTLEEGQPLMQRRQRSLDPVERGVQSRRRRSRSDDRSGRSDGRWPRDGSQVGSGERARNGGEGRSGRSSRM